MNSYPRRDFLKNTAFLVGASAMGASGLTDARGDDENILDAPSFAQLFCNPPREYSLVPFWFLNDMLEETELRRQLDDFAAHGVYGVVPHARMGLAKEFAFMSDRWLHMLRVCVEHAARNDMFIILYDEGMYPSGSCAGQVVAANPRHATRCLERRQLGASLHDDEILVHQDDAWQYVNIRSLGVIRGVHYGMDDGDPDAPPSADILNPESVASFLHLTHDRHYKVLDEYFGATIRAIFTDEPDVLGRRHKRDVQPWTWDFDRFLADYLGYDFLPHLGKLWEDALPDPPKYRADFKRAVNARLEQSYYKPYHDWCEDHHIALTGHPAGSMDIGTLRYFHWPGQDVVWRYLEPFQDKSLEEPHSTMGKCSASAKVNHGRSRNLNECFGAYGWEFTYEEMRWLTDWLLVRGVDMISPHAFYYSVRDERRNERPPDVGPNNTWWDRYKPYADYCRRISWLNAVGEHLCDIAILSTATQLPWRAARVFFEHQRDFNYLDTDTLKTQTRVDDDGFHIGAMHYKVLVLDGAHTVDPGVLEILAPCMNKGRVVAYGEAIPGVSALAANSKELLEAIAAIAPPDVILDPSHKNIRYRHVRINAVDAYYFTNEGDTPVESSLTVGASGAAVWWDPEIPEILKDMPAQRLAIAPYQSRLLCVS